MSQSTCWNGHAGGYDYRMYPGSGGPSAPCLFFTDVGMHPFDGQEATKGLNATVVALEIQQWDDDMTPWPAPGLYPGDPDFKGHADQTLDTLLHQVIPAIDEAHGLHPSARALTGYSLGGLFSLYGFLKEPTFCAASSMSGSLWYEGWISYLESLANTHRPLEGCFAYLSIGDRESKAKEEILHSVQKNNEASAEILRQWGVTTQYQLNHGNHFQQVNQRIALGLRAVDDFFLTKERTHQI